jgi:hypothetical protein
MRKTILVLTSSLISSLHAGSVEGLLKGFTDEPEFVKPLATTAGSMMNANWVRGAKVSEPFYWSIGLPFQLTFISDDDRMRSNQSPHPASAGELPTIFGPSEPDYSAATAAQSWTNKGHFGDVNTIPFFSPELTLGGKGFLARTRMMALPEMPAGGHKASLSWFGIGAQQQFNRYIDPKLSKPLPFDIGLALRKQWFSSDFTPKNYTGKVALSGQSWGLDLVVGKTLNCQCVELFGTLGYEAASLSGSGTVKHNQDFARTFITDQTLLGANGMRLSIGVKTSVPGRDFWKPSASFGVGAQNTLAIDLLHN